MLVVNEVSGVPAPYKAVAPDLVKRRGELRNNAAGVFSFVGFFFLVFITAFTAASEFDVFFLFVAIFLLLALVAVASE